MNGGRAPRPGTEPRSTAELLGDELLSLRLERGLSLRKLARLVGMTAHSGLVDYERGNRIPPNDLMSSYVRVLQPPNDHLAQLYRAAVAERARRKLETVTARTSTLVTVHSMPTATSSHSTGDDLATIATASARTDAQYRTSILMIDALAQALENAARSLRDAPARWPTVHGL